MILAIIIYCCTGLISQFDILSFKESLYLAKSTLSDMLIVILTASTINMALKSNNINEFCKNLGLLLLGLAFLACISIIFNTIIGLVASVVGVLFISDFYLEEFIILKMQKPASGNETTGNDSSGSGNGGGSGNSGKPDPYPGIVDVGLYDKNYNKQDTENALNKIENRWNKNSHNFDGKNAFIKVEGDPNNLNFKEEMAVITAVNQYIGDEEHTYQKGTRLETAIKGANSQDRNVLSNSGLRANKGDLLKLTDNYDKYESCNMPRNKSLITDALEDQLERSSSDSGSGGKNS